MVKELAGQDIAGLSRIPVSARRHLIRLVEKVSEANFRLAIKVTESCAPFPEIKHDVAFRALVENQGYPQKLLEIDVPLRNTLENLEGEYYYDDNKLLSYKKVSTKDVAGLINLPEEVRDMQLVLRTNSPAIQEDSDEEVVDMFAIIKEGQPALVATSVNPEQPQAAFQPGGKWTQIKKPF